MCDALSSTDFRMTLAFLTGDIPQATSTTLPGPQAKKLGLMNCFFPANDLWFFGFINRSQFSTASGRGVKRGSSVSFLL